MSNLLSKNRPLTLAQIHAVYDSTLHFDRLCALEPLGIVGFAYNRNTRLVHAVVIDRFLEEDCAGIVAVWNGNNDDNFMDADYGETWVYFLRPPTQEEVDAIQWGKEHYQ